MHSHLRSLSFSWSAITALAHLSSSFLCEVRFAANRSEEHFLFRLDIPLLLPLQELLMSIFSCRVLYSRAVSQASHNLPTSNTVGVSDPTPPKGVLSLHATAVDR